MLIIHLLDLVYLGSCWKKKTKNNGQGMCWEISFKKISFIKKNISIWNDQCIFESLSFIWEKLLDIFDTLYQ